MQRPNVKHGKYVLFGVASYVERQRAYNFVGQTRHLSACEFLCEAVAGEFEGVGGGMEVVREITQEMTSSRPAKPPPLNYSNPQPTSATQDHTQPSPASFGQAYCKFETLENCRSEKQGTSSIMRDRYAGN